MNDLLALAQFLRRSCHHYMVLKTPARPPPPLARILVEKLFVGKFREMHPPPERNGLGMPLVSIFHLRL
jgi:hypothetical protein